MKAVYFEQHGELDALRYGDVPEPAPRAGEALIRVRACGLNYLDVWVRRGWPGLKPFGKHSSMLLRRLPKTA